MNAAILNLCLAATGAVFVVMLVTVWVSYKSRRSAEASPGSLGMELIWTVIPWLIVIAAAAPAAIEIMRNSRSGTTTQGRSAYDGLARVARQKSVTSMTWRGAQNFRHNAGTPPIKDLPER